jgi:recombination protein RecT
MATSLTVRAQELRTQLDEKADTLFKTAPSGIDATRFSELAVRACIANPDLFECTRASLFTAIAGAVSLGLEIGGPLGQCYLIPFRNNAKNTLEAVLVPGYLGLKELAYRSGKIASLEMQPVHPGDEFDFQKGTSPYINHKPSDTAANGAVTHVYAIVKTTTFGTIFEVMSWPQVERHRDKFAKGARRADSAWKTNPVAMALKTVLRKALKLAPLSPELQRMMQTEEYAEQPPFASGMEAPVEDLDAAAALLDEPPQKPTPPDIVVIKEGATKARRPSDPTPEELADLKREQQQERRAGSDKLFETADPYESIPF